MTFLDSIFFLPIPLRKLPEAFGLTSSKSWYPHLFNSQGNLEYVGSIPDISYYGVNEMSEAERKEFIVWYQGQRDKVFDNKRVLEEYCQDDVTAASGMSLVPTRIHKNWKRSLFRNLLPYRLHVTSCCVNVFKARRNWNHTAEWLYGQY
jgi:hypothetical protein